MEITLLRAFAEVADAGSVSRAARRLGIAQPSLSVQLQRLETHLGVRLLDRHARGVTLTDAGRALLPRARRILEDIRLAEEVLRHDVATGQGTLTVGAIPTIAPYLLPLAIEQLRAVHPAARVEIREDYSAGLAEALADYLIDCAIVATPFAYDTIELEPLGADPLLVAVPRSHAAAAQGTISLDALRQSATITLDRAHCLGEQVAVFCASNQVAAPVTCRTAQLTTVFALVAAGAGVSIVPAMAAAQHRDSRLTCVALGDTPLERQIVAAWRRDRTRSHLARTFVGFVREALSSSSTQRSRSRSLA